MFSRCAFQVLIVFLTICMLKTGTRAATYNETCTDNASCSTPADTLVCELTSATAADHRCKIKSGANCASHENDCVDGATCTGSTTKQCTCPSWRPAVQATGACAAAPGSGAVGGPCATSSPACTGQDLVCEDNICKTKHGSDCSTHAYLCVNGAICPTSVTKNCECDSGRMPPTQGLCAAKVPVSGNCTGGKTCEDNLVCDGNICKIKNGNSCTGHENDCVDGATCTGTTNKQCICHSWRSPAAQNGTCAGAPASGAAGGSCATSSPACTGQDLVCEDSTCKIKHGADCTTQTDLCVKNAACPTSGAKNCSCDSTKFSATGQGLCGAKSGAPSLLPSLLFVVGLLVTSRLI